MPVALLRRSGQLLSSLAGPREQSLRSTEILLKERAEVIAARIKVIVDKSSAEDIYERPLHVDLNLFSSSIKRIFKVMYMSF